jgi:predicted transcriptional regulator
MTTLNIRIESLEDTRERILEVWNDHDSGAATLPDCSLSFPSYDAMYRVLAPSRMAIVTTLAGQGPLSIREVARRVGRDVKAVHTDVTALIKAGVIDRTAKGVEFPYDGMEFAFTVTAAA